MGDKSSAANLTYALKISKQNNLYLKKSMTNFFGGPPKYNSGTQNPLVFLKGPRWTHIKSKVVSEHAY